MNLIYKTLFAVAVCLMAFGTGKVQAQESNRLSVENLTAAQGEQVVLPVILNNQSQICAFSFKLTLPEGVAVTTNANNKPVATLGGRADDHVISGNLKDGIYYFACLSLSSTPFANNTGIVCNITLNVSSTATTGTVDIKDIELTSPNNTKYNPGDVSCTLTVGNGSSMSDESFTIDDTSTSFSNSEKTEYGELSYTRSFGTTNYQCLYVPMTINMDDIANDFVVYKLGAVFLFDSNGDGAYFGENDESVIRIFKVNSGVLKPNHPYYIKAKTTGKKTIPSYDNILYPSDENTFESSTLESISTFKGNYTKQSFGKEFFTISAGEIYKMKSTATLGAFRWYMTIANKDGQLLEIPTSAKLEIISDDDPRATVIDEAIANGISVKAVYSIDGIQINKMQKGINIIRYSDGKTKKVYKK